MTCYWYSNNCGPNDEPFAFHPNGCNSVFVDGSVHFLPDNIDGIVLRRLVTRAEATQLSDSITTAGTQYHAAATFTPAVPPLN